jgi:hypothetical protein
MNAVFRETMNRTVKFLQYSQAIKRHPSLIVSLMKNRSISKLKESFFYLERAPSLSKTNQVFVFDGRQYNYYYSNYYFTWATERTVEVPIISAILTNYRGKRILEIGNVLLHHQPIDHLVVDKYEVGDGVMNIDVVDFKPDSEFDLIVSISTMEHVGWDESPRDPQKLLRAIFHLRELLSDSGEFWMTAPLGYNKFLRTLLDSEKIPWAKLCFMKRISSDNSWSQVTWKEARMSRYGYPYNSANAILIGCLKKHE